MHAKTQVVEVIHQVSTDSDRRIMLQTHAQWTTDNKQRRRVIACSVPFSNPARYRKFFARLEYQGRVFPKTAYQREITILSSGEATRKHDLPSDVCCSATSITGPCWYTGVFLLLSAAKNMFCCRYCGHVRNELWNWLLSHLL